jgi:hypothetical protein
VRLLALLARPLLGLRLPASPAAAPSDSERLQRIYRETHRQVEHLRRAA